MLKCICLVMNTTYILSSPSVRNSLTSPPQEGVNREERCVPQGIIILETPHKKFDMIIYKYYKRRIKI